MFNQLKNSSNPAGMVQSMFGSNPLFQRAVEMAKGKSPEEIKQTALNIAQQRGISKEQAQQILSNFGIKL